MPTAPEPGLAAWAIVPGESRTRFSLRKLLWTVPGEIDIDGACTTSATLSVESSERLRAPPKPNSSMARSRSRSGDR